MRSEKVCEIRGGQMVECFVGEDQNVVVDAMGDRKPAEVFEDWGDVMLGMREETCSCILNPLESVEGCSADAVKK